MQSFYLMTDAQLDFLVERAFKKILEAKNPELPTPVFYTQSECSAILHCSIPTIIDYRKKGWLKGRKVGLKILYTQADIDEAVKVIAVAKYKRV